MTNTINPECGNCLEATFRIGRLDSRTRVVEQTENTVSNYKSALGSCSLKQIIMGERLLIKARLNSAEAQLETARARQAIASQNVDQIEECSGQKSYLEPHEDGTWLTTTCGLRPGESTSSLTHRNATT